MFVCLWGRKNAQKKTLRKGTFKPVVLTLVSKWPVLQIDVMEHAAAYIEKLQNNLIGQIRTHGYPEKLRTVAPGLTSVGGGGGSLDDRETIKRNVDKYVCTTMTASK